MRKLSLAIAILVSLPLPASVSLADTYTAFSFKSAREQSGQQGSDHGELRGIGITKAVALIHDRDNDDVIIVGKISKGQKPITLDDWVVAVRAILQHRQDPAVSIDRTEDTDTTRVQRVRFGGGLEDTQFGKDLLDADVVLKRLGLGRISAAVFGLRSYLDLSVDDYKTNGEQNKLVSRFWFQPDKASSYVTARDGIVVVEEYKIAVTNQVMGSDGNISSDHVGEYFASDLQNNFSDIKLYFPELGRMEQLYYLAALAQGLDASGISKSSLVSYWLDGYSVNRVTTPRVYPLEENSRELENVTIEVSGGVSLDTLVVDLQDGVASSIKKYILSSRPHQQALSWEVPLMSLVWDTIYDPTRMERLIGEEKQKLNLGMSLLKNVIPRNVGPSTYTSSNNFRIDQVPLSNSFSSDFLNNNNWQDMHPMASPNIGGVMLSGVASLSDSGPARVDLSGGNFSFIVDGKNAKLAPEAFRKFITALWAVYYSNQDPGISIDPIAPGVDKHLVRYIGKVINTDLGRVMRDADYLMKKWSVGTERPDIPGFKNPDDYAAEERVVHLAASRFWFIPENMKFKRSDDMLLFDRGRMTIQTEYLIDSPDRRASLENEKFASFFTEHYNEFSEKYPVYDELFEYAKMVSLAKYLKEQGVPLFWFLMANKDLVITEDSPGTVDELVKDSDYFREITISGGVDLGFDTANQGNYVYDQAAVTAIQEARSQYSSNAQSSTSVSYERRNAVTGANPFSFDLGKNSYSVVPQHSLTSGRDRNGIRYQTDVAVRGRGFQLTQHSLELLESELVYRETMKEMQPILEKLDKDDLDQEEMVALYEVKKKKAEDRVLPMLERLDDIKDKKYSDDHEFVIALEKSIGVEQTKKLKSMIMKASYYSTSLELVRYFDSREPSGGEFGAGWRLLVPFKIEPYGTEKQQFLNIMVSKQMTVVNLLTGEEEILTFNTDRYSSAGYVPDEIGNSQVVGLFLMSDASHRLKDKLGNEFWFNSQGHLTDMVFSEDHRIQYEYLNGFTDAFEHPPYQIEPFGTERVDFSNVSIPKRMRLNDLVHGGSEILTFGEEGAMSGYMPENAEDSIIKIMVLMSDASFRLIDRKGNESALTPSGEFEGMAISDERPMVSAVFQGNHRIAFTYTIGKSGNVMIAGASFSEGGNDQSPTFMVQYEYDTDGKLAAVKKSR